MNDVVFRYLHLKGINGRKMWSTWDTMHELLDDCAQPTAYAVNAHEAAARRSMAEPSSRPRSMVAGRVAARAELASQLETRKGTSGAAIVQDLVNCALELTEDQIAEFKECFALFDEDGSGTVDCAELGNVMKSLGQKMTDEELQTMITYVDADGSGTVDFAEFLGMMARQMKDHDSDLVLQRSFDLLDTDGTGRVSKGNLCYVLGVLCDKMTSAEIEELVDEAVRVITIQEVK